MRIIFLLIMALPLAATTRAHADDRPCVAIVVGAQGTSEYGAEFQRWAKLWQEAAAKGKAECVTIGAGAAGAAGQGTDRDRLRALVSERGSAGNREPLWIVLIGHGSFDGREAKFNLRGPDVSDVELAQWLASVQRPIAVINCASASGPFLPRLSGPNRIVISATRSGDEQNFARFGQYLAESIADAKADLDKDGQVSLLEAFLMASRRAEEFYKTRSRLATEHALLDDNGDKLGTPPDWFRGVRAIRRAKDGAAADGLRAHQLHLVPSDREQRLPVDVRRRRDRLELDIAALRDQKSKLKADDYYKRLETLMVELAKLYQGEASKPESF